MHEKRPILVTCGFLKGKAEINPQFEPRRFGYLFGALPLVASWSPVAISPFKSRGKAVNIALGWYDIVLHYFGREAGRPSRPTALRLWRRRQAREV